MNTEGTRASGVVPTKAIAKGAELRGGEEGVGVRADGEEGSIAEVEQARKANHDIEAEGENHVLGGIGQLTDERRWLHAKEGVNSPCLEVGLVVHKWQDKQEQQHDSHNHQ